MDGRILGGTNWEILFHNNRRDPWFGFAATYTGRVDYAIRRLSCQKALPASEIGLHTLPQVEVETFNWGLCRS